MNARARGFTLIELLVVIAIIGILSSVVLASMNNARKKGRDARRRQDLKAIQTALELYYDTNGQYPTTSSGWWGNCSSYGSHGTTGSTGWVPNLAPTYMSILPLDPRSADGNVNSCYLYRSDGADYKLLAHLSVETGTCPPIAAGDGMYEPARSGSQCTIGLFSPGAVAW
jgi:general secretion pathway protein G